MKYNLDTLHEVSPAYAANAQAKAIASRDKALDKGFAANTQKETDIHLAKVNKRDTQQSKFGVYATKKLNKAAGF